MTGTPEVTVVIPVYNGERFVQESIESALGQQGVSTEVIVVDNGSTDRTKEVVARYGSAVALLSEPQPGSGSARNTGARQGRSEYLAFLDADDIWFKDKLQRQLRELRSRVKIGMIFGLGQEFHDPVLAPDQRARFPCRPAPYEFVAASTCLTVREAFLQTGGFPGSSAGEFIAWYGWAQTLGMYSFVLPELCVWRRVHATNTSRDRHALAGYATSTKWLLDRRRQLH